MATTKKSAGESLSAIKKRLRENKLKASDIKQLERIILNVQDAAKKLRAAVVE
ncbi:MAG TPA: hypothetical protein VFN30_09660 [Chitinophagaceae bacterium]|nr:hypothetical protein [Chitinophagaceae bacterium]